MPFQWWRIVCYFLVFDLNIRCLNKLWKIRLNVYWSHSYSLHVIKEDFCYTLRREKYHRSITLCSLSPIHHFLWPGELGIWFSTSYFFEEYVFRIVRGKQLVLSPRISCFNIDIFPKSFLIFLLGYFIYLRGPW